MIFSNQVGSICTFPLIECFTPRAFTDSWNRNNFLNDNQSRAHSIREKKWFFKKMKDA